MNCFFGRGARPPETRNTVRLSNACPEPPAGKIADPALANGKAAAAFAPLGNNAEELYGPQAGKLSSRPGGAVGAPDADGVRWCGIISAACAAAIQAASPRNAANSFCLSAIITASVSLAAGCR